jgi:DNA-binding CsgD family transcriptional regulator
MQPPRSLFLAAFGRRDDARAVLLRQREAARTGSAVAPDSTPTSSLEMFLESATLIGDADLAAWFAAPLWDCGTVTTGWMYTTMVNRHLGAAAALLGHPERALGYYERALADATAMRFRPEVALTRLGLAELLAGDFGKSDEGLDHLRLAIPEFEAMGMAPSLARAQALQDEITSRARPQPGLPGGLSEREAEVLRLIAIGKTNGEIAEALVISPHTVGRHVSNIFDKLSITHRADAAAWAVRNGLVE